MRRNGARGLPVAAAAAAAAAALALGGCGSGDKRRPQPSPAPTPPSDAALVQRALDSRARRIAALPQTRALGVRDVRMRLQDLQLSGDRATVRARLAYRVEGVAGEFGARRALSATRSGTRWRVAPSRAARDRAPWEVADYERIALDHFVVWRPRGLDTAPLPRALSGARARMRRMLGGAGPRRRHLVVVARDARAARRMTGSIRGLGGLTALTDTEVRETGASRRVRGVASQRLLVIWPAFASLAPGLQRSVLAHELTHAVLAPRTSGRVPGWLSEGLAMYVSGDRRTGEAARLLGGGAVARVSRRALALRALSAPDALGRLSGDAQAAAYAYASAAAFAIAGRYGRERLLALQDAFSSDAVTGPAGDPRTVDAAVRRTLGVSLATLERRIRAGLGG